MLRDVVAGFLDSVSEREFDAPVLALLAGRGFRDIHFMHGGFEFGKDFIGKGLKPVEGDTGTGDPHTWELHQFALQSKAGKMGLSAWREVRPQLDEARNDDLAHPAFDTKLRRAGVLIVTGRLTGGAPIQAQSYRESERRKGRPDFEIWDRETLLEWLVDSPEVGLAGVADGPILAIVGAIESGDITQSALERYARSWVPPVPGSLQETTTPLSEIDGQRRRALVEAAVIVNRLRRSERLDLAALAALLLLRSSWCHELKFTSATDTELLHRSPATEAAARLFAGTAYELFRDLEPIAGESCKFLNATALGPLLVAHVSYSATCLRVSEVLGLLGLLVSSESTGLSELDPTLTEANVYEMLRKFISANPTALHPIGDSFAVGLIPPILLLARHDSAFAQSCLIRATIWVADQYDEDLDGLGLAAPWVDPAAELKYLLNSEYDYGPDRRQSSYLTTVLIDLAAVIGEDSSLYSDILNEVLAVEIAPQAVISDERVAQWRPDGPGTSLVPRVHYLDPMPHDLYAASHYNLGVLIPAWDSVALALTVRDRHPVAAMRAIIES